MKRWQNVEYKEYMHEYHQEYDTKYYKANKARIQKRKIERRLEIREWFWNEVKSKIKCSRCPESYWACIDFHHTDGSKEYAVADLASKGFSKARILREIAKCIPLCANCHRKEHNRV